MLVQWLCNACGLRRRREEAKADKAGLDTQKEKGNGESSSSEDVKKF